MRILDALLKIAPFLDGLWFGFAIAWKAASSLSGLPPIHAGSTLAILLYFASMGVLMRAWEWLAPQWRRPVPSSPATSKEDAAWSSLLTRRQ